MVRFDYFTGMAQLWVVVVGRPMCAGHYSRPLKFVVGIAQPWLPQLH